LLAAALIALGATAARADDKVPVWLGIGYTNGGLGVVVTEVHEETGAAAAGIKPGDEIVELGGVQTPAGTDLKPIISPLKVGDHLKIKVLRGGKVVALEAVMLPRMPDSEIVQRRLVGKPAPEFAITRAADDAVVDLRAIKGKVAILAFFPPSCDRCAGVVSELGAWASKHDRDPVVVLGGTPLELPGLKSFLSRNPMVIPVGALTRDPDRPSDYIADASTQAVTFVVIDGKGLVRLASVVPPGAEDEVEDVCVAAERALRTLRRR
jgi:membrane-associated protease RseP (regulator of RpoE activity)